MAFRIHTTGWLTTLPTLSSALPHCTLSSRQTGRHTGWGRVWRSVTFTDFRGGNAPTVADFHLLTWYRRAQSWEEVPSGSSRPPAGPPSLPSFLSAVTLCAQLCGSHGGLLQAFTQIPPSQRGLPPPPSPHIPFPSSSHLPCTSSRSKIVHRTYLSCVFLTSRRRM